MPGYIEAFSRTFETDWDAYVAEAADQLRQATDVVRRDRDRDRGDVDHRRREVTPAQREPERASRPVRGFSSESLDNLRAVIAEHDLPNEGAQAFLAALTEALTDLGPSDPRLLLMIRPYAELLASNDFRMLRRNLERVDPDEALEQEALANRERVKDLLPATKGRRALLVGGDMREDRRRSIQTVFNFELFDWASFDRSRPGVLKAVEQRIREGSFDLLFLHAESIGEALAESLAEIAEESDVVVLLAQRGTSVADLTEILRKNRADLGVSVSAGTNGANGSTHDEDPEED